MARALQVPLFAAVLSLSCMACDSGDPTPDVNLQGVYAAEWTEAGTLYRLRLDIDTADGRIEGDAEHIVFLNDDPFTTYPPISGFVDGNRVRFSLQLGAGFNFSGTAAPDGESFEGTVFRAVPGPSPSGYVDRETSVEFSRPT